MSGRTGGTAVRGVLRRVSPDGFKALLDSQVRCRSFPWGPVQQGVPAAEYAATLYYDMGHGYAHRWMVKSHLSQRRRILILSVWNEQPFSSDFAEDVVADIIFPSVWPMALSQKVFQCPRGWPTALPLLYGRARSSDFRNIDRVVLDFCEGNDRTGYIEIHTVDYRCARLSRVTGRPFIVLIPVYVLCAGERLSQHTVFSWWFFGATKLAERVM